jgi:hypothetical protein
MIWVDAFVKGYFIGAVLSAAGAALLRRRGQYNVQLSGIAVGALLSLVFGGMIHLLGYIIGYVTGIAL